MIDIHSHILPGVDDGAKNLDEALALLRMAVADGVSTQVLTPHIHQGVYNNTPGSLIRAFTEFSQQVFTAGIKIRLRLASEVRISPDLIDWVATNKILWLGRWQRSKVFLLEFPHNHIPVGSVNVISQLRQQEIIPMIVHPERNRELLDNPNKIQPFVDMGCLIQLTAGSITGGFGRACRRLAKILLEKGWVTVIATDCHNIRYRPPSLRSGMQAAAKIVGSAAAMDMVTRTPSIILGLQRVIAPSNLEKDFDKIEDSNKLASNLQAISVVAPVSS